MLRKSLMKDTDYLIYLIKTGHNFIGGLWHDYPHIMGHLNNLVAQCLSRSTNKFTITWDKTDVPNGLEEILDFFDDNGFHYCDDQESGSIMRERTIYFNLYDLNYNLRHSS